LSLGQGLENRLWGILLMHELVRPRGRIDDVGAFLGQKNLTTAQGYAQVRVSPPRIQLEHPPRRNDV